MIAEPLWAQTTFLAEKHWRKRTSGDQYTWQKNGKVDTCKSHGREAMVNMEPFVQENDANRGTYVNE